MSECDHHKKKGLKDAIIGAESSSLGKEDEEAKSDEFKLTPLIMKSQLSSMSLGLVASN